MESVVLAKLLLVLVRLVSHSIISNAWKTVHIDGKGETRVVEYLTENFHLNCNSRKQDMEGLLKWKTDRKIRSCDGLKPSLGVVCVDRSRNNTHRMALLMFGKIYRESEGFYTCYRKSVLKEESQSVFVKVIVNNSAPPISISIQRSWKNNVTRPYENVCCLVKSVIDNFAGFNITWNNEYGVPVQNWLGHGKLGYHTRNEKCLILYYFVDSNSSHVYICEVSSPYYNNTVTKTIEVPMKSYANNTVTEATEVSTETTQSMLRSTLAVVHYNNNITSSEEAAVSTSSLSANEQSNWNHLVIISMSIAGSIILAVGLFIVCYCLRCTSSRSVWDDLYPNMKMVERQIAKKLSWLQKEVVELQPVQLEVVDVIGRGFFGVVCEARVRNSGGFQGPREVAVKMVNDEMDREAYSSLVDEAILMNKFGGHSHVVTLLGICLQMKGCPWLIFELAKHGNLRGYLRSHRPQGTLTKANSEDASTSDGYLSIISTEKALTYALQIAKGMEYLISQMCLHRDLAARNVLVFADECLKISDFGLAKDIHYQEYYRKQSSGIIPVKWTAPEALFYKVYSEASDIWSFGVVLWEIVTRGGTPYPGVDVVSLYRLLSATPPYRMSRPRGCSQAVYDLMFQCWKNEPSSRPTFSSLVTDITGLTTLEAAKNDNVVEVEK